MPTDQDLERARALIGACTVGYVGGDCTDHKFEHEDNWCECCSLSKSVATLLADTRERCAVIAENPLPTTSSAYEWGEQIAAAIRGSK